MKKISFLLGICIACLTVNTCFALSYSPLDCEVEHYSSDKIFTKHYYTMPFYLLLLSDKGTVYTWGNCQRQRNESALAYDGILFSAGHKIIFNEDKEEGYRTERLRFDTPTAIADSIIDVGFVDLSDSDQIIYYLTKKGDLYFLENNTARLIKENIVSLDTGSFMAYSIRAIDSNGTIWLIKRDNAENVILNMGKVDIGDSNIRKFDIIYYDKYYDNEVFKAEILTDNGELVLYDSANGTKEILQTNVGYFKHYQTSVDSLKHYSEADNKPSPLNVDCDLALTRDKKLICKGTDFVTGKEYPEYTEITDNVAAFDVVELRDGAKSDYVLTVLKNDNTLWVQGKNDVLRLGDPQNVETDTLTMVEENVKSYWIEAPAFMGKHLDVTNYILKTDGTLWGKGNFVTSPYIDEEDFSDEKYYCVAKDVEHFNAYGWSGTTPKEDFYPFESGIIMLKKDGSADIQGMLYGLDPFFAEHPVCIFTDFNKGIVNNNFSANYHAKYDKPDNYSSVSPEYIIPLKLYLYLGIILFSFLIIYIYIIICDGKKILK